jgi:methionyl-tRNA formyltransferase
MKKLRVLFFWTPQLSADILSYLLTKEQHIDIIWVVSNPDKIGGRGHEVIPSPVTQLAREKNLLLLQPEKIKNEEFLNTVRELSPDVCIVVAYGKILPQVLLDIPPMGFLNVHTSLLPKYRGAAPIQYALMNGEETTGLTIMQMSLWMDEGDILLQETWHISPSDTTDTLFMLTGKQAGPLLIEALEGLQNWDIVPTPQDHKEATYTKMIEKKDGELKPNWTLEEAYHRWQAYTPWPGLYSYFGDTRVTFLEVEMSHQWEMLGEGTWTVIDKTPAIILSNGFLIIKKIHPAWKKPMSGEEFVRGFMKS